MIRLRFFVICLIFVLITGEEVWAKKFPWNVVLDAPVQEDLYIVVKGVYANLNDAKETQSLIQTTLKNIPADGIVSSNKLHGFPKNKFVVASLFDDPGRAKWWMQFSHRNPRLPNPQMKQIKLLENVDLPYLPSSSRKTEKRFISEKEAIDLVKNVSDIKILRAQNPLKFMITDYPRSGDLRYEVEVLKLTKNNPRGVMVDFFMVDAVNQKITERFTQSIKPKKQSLFR